MGCIKVGHRHVWPTEGLLIIQRCEIRCNFCTGAAARKNWKYAWFLRRHVRAVHVGKKGQGQYPKLIVDDSWDDAKLQHMQLQMQRLGRTSTEIKFIEQPEFEEQALTGIFHHGTGGQVQPQFFEDADIYNGGEPGFFENAMPTYPAFADEQAAMDIQNPFTYHEMEGFVFNAAMNQTEFPTGHVEPDEVADEANVTGDEAPTSLEVNTAPPEIEANPQVTAHPRPSSFGKTEIDWSAAPRFFMEDYDYTSTDEDDLDEKPLVEVFHQYPTEPSLTKAARIMNMLDATHQQMVDEGIPDAHMLPWLAMFSRGLISRNEDRESESA